MHNIEHYTYDENVNQKKVQHDLDIYVQHADWGEGASGLPNAIRWVGSPIYEDREAAEAAIEAADKSRWYNCMAVKYKEYPRCGDTKEITELRKKYIKAVDDYTRIAKEASIQNRTSEFIGCPSCKSSLKRELIRGERCPLCKAELRSNTNIARLDKAKAKYEEYEQKITKAETVASKRFKPKIKWLVKIEYHT